MKIKELLQILIIIMLLAGCSSNSSDSNTNSNNPEEPIETTVVSVTIGGDTLTFLVLDNVETTSNETSVSANVELEDDTGDYIYSVSIPYEALGISSNSTYDFFMTSEVE